MINIFFHSLMTFIDLAALSSVVGTVLCLLWSMWPKCDDAPANKCFGRCRRLLFYCLIGLSVTGVGDLLQRTMEMAGVGFAASMPFLSTVVLDSHYGSMWLLRTFAVALIWCIWLFGRKRLDSRLVAFLLLSACFAIAFSRSASSHAADYGDLSIQQLSDWFHLLAAISWGGALLSFSVVLPISDVTVSAEQQQSVAEMADRFYACFGPVFAVLMATGLYNTWIEVRSYEALVTTSYGRYLAAKLLIFACLTARYIAPPQKGRDQAAYAVTFLRRCRVDALLILGILLFVSLFTHEVPARHAGHMMMDHEQKMDSTHETGADHDMSHHMMHGHGM